MKFIKNQQLDEAFELLNSSLVNSIDQSDVFNSYLSEIETNQKKFSYSSSELLDISKYKKNPYLKLLSNINISQGNINLKIEKIKKFTSFLYDEVTYSSPLLEENNPIGHFDEDFIFPILYKGKTPWMSIVPHEIETMKDSINEASGNVLTFGLGLGYFAYMVSLKTDVKEVMIVETDSNVISIFKKYILPTFENKNKIKIIQANCIEFAKNSSLKFDYLFVDTYHTPEDGLPFIGKLKPYLNKISNKTTFWIMPSMITYFRRYLIAAFLDIYYEEVDISIFDEDCEDYLDNLLSKYIRSLKNIEIRDVESLEKVLSQSSIYSNLLNI